MRKIYLIAGAAIFLCLICMSCERLPKQISGTDLTDLSSIPASYGNLISVTSIPAYPEWVQMWFQDTAGTIRIVRVEFRTYRMAKDVKEISRN